MSEICITKVYLFSIEIVLGGGGGGGAMSTSSPSTFSMENGLQDKSSYILQSNLKSTFGVNVGQIQKH